MKVLAPNGVDINITYEKGECIMKLKDFKNNPAQYQEMVNLMKIKGIAADDEADINDILAESKNFSDAAQAMANGANKGRKM